MQFFSFFSLKEYGSILNVLMTDGYRDLKSKTKILSYIPGLEDITYPPVIPLSFTENFPVGITNFLFIVSLMYKASKAGLPWMSILLVLKKSFSIESLLASPDLPRENFILYLS